MATQIGTNISDALKETQGEAYVEGVISQVGTELHDALTDED